MKRINRKTKQKAVLIIALLLTGTGAWSQEELTLTYEKALEISYNNNPLIKQSKLSEKESDMRRKAAKGLYFPQISLSGNYQHLSDNIHLDLNPVKEAITPLYETLGQYGNFSDVPNPDPATQDVMPVLPQDQSTEAIRGQMMDAAHMLNSKNWNRTIQEKQFATVSARFKWPVFTGGKIDAANKTAALKREEARQQTKENKQALNTELVERYYGLRLAEAVITIREEVLKLMDTHYYEAQRLYEEGMIAEAQLLHARVYRAEAQRKLKRARSDHYIATKALRNTLSVDKDKAIKTVSPLFYLSSIDSPDNFVKEALRNNAHLQQMTLKKKMAHQNYRVQKSDYLPTVAVAGMYDIYNKDLSPYAPEWIAGVNLKWNLFDGMARTNKVKAARYQEERVEQVRAKAENDIATLVEKLHQQLQMNIEQIEELEASAEYTREYLDVSRRSFREGMATSTDVTQASLALSQVQTEKLQVMYDYVTTLSELLEISGKSEEFHNYQHQKNTVFENDLNLTENE